MNEIAKAGYIMGVTLKNRKEGDAVKRKISSLIGNYSTFEDKLDCLIRFSDVTNKLIPYSIIEGNEDDMRMFLLGIINGLS